MNCRTNPDMFRMFEYARQNMIVPNYTTHGLDVDAEVVRETARLCGAVAVSVVNPEATGEAVRLFTQAGMRQVNVHFMLSEERFDEAIHFLEGLKTDPRYNLLNAVVFLQYKSKGRTPDAFHAISSVEKYRQLVNTALNKHVGFGFDSCSAPMFLKAMEGTPDFRRYLTLAEPCESALFSSYINCKGDFYPCSFMEGANGWRSGVNVLQARDFLHDVWTHDRIIRWRSDLLASSSGCTSCELRKHCRSCPEYSVSACKDTCHEVR
jgi:radical SAM protein with 4Fe4S-binding SPASM domain